MAVDMDKLHEFMGRFVADLGATFAAGNVVIGHNLGLYRALAEGPAHPAELAERTGTDPRYVTEWLRGQAAGGYVEYDPANDTYSMTEEQVFTLTNPDGGVYLPGAFVLALGALKAEPRITEAFRTGDGMGWHEHDQYVFTGCEQFFRPGYAANLVPSWIPALDGVQDKLRAGANVADIGCGLGASAILLAQEYPNSRFTGSDYHEQSIEIARKRAADAGVGDRIRFEVASATDFSGSDYDLAATFDCLHDMGDPLAAARHVSEVLEPDGTWMVVEPNAADDVADNLNPVGRVYYNASSQLCVPNALSQSGGYALGAQAGEAAIRQVTADAGFTRFRRVAETPLNAVYEVRP
ncbi:methyltransferase domain-containing protein [Nocardia sp. CA2R105]|uniref:class I SAM-dependent methyltransferase n=1 Tax=Nocardia coffeae TaxID=2873381 RepID=UPI001CA6117F|nr:class I SAM-dependent methyltransferase [Nocardia coffeae]MBY8857270.1 methyltransferase domain-containing protein [Nocardia coffeae]